MQSKYIQVDETSVKVLTSVKKNSSHKGYHWVFHSPPDGLIYFHYDKSRSGDVPKELLELFQGILQTDAYFAYNQFNNRDGIISIPCMAHIRRKFYDAQQNDKERSEKVLYAISKLYQVERIIRNYNLSEEKILDFRKRFSLKIMNDLQKWFEQEITKVLPRSKIGEAIGYALGLWKKMKRYIDYPYVLIDNNLVENSIRPVALGRKNYLFAGSHDGAKRAAMMYSFFAICKIHDVNPQEWLTKILNVIPDFKTSKLEKLLPQNFNL